MLLAIIKTILWIFIIGDIEIISCCRHHFTAAIAIAIALLFQRTSMNRMYELFQIFTYCNRFIYCYYTDILPKCIDIDCSLQIWMKALKFFDETMTRDALTIDLSSIVGIHML